MDRKISNLKDIDDKVRDTLEQLQHCTSNTSLVIELANQINLLETYFGIKILKMDVGPFKKGDKVCFTQDESGVYITALDNSKTIDLFYYMIPENELFVE